MTMDARSERLGEPASPDLADLRLQMETAAAKGAWDTLPPAECCTVAGIRALRFTVASPLAIIVHFHGGGYRLGCPEAAGPFARALADRCQMEVVCPEYRLAPEHPYPAALNDGLAIVTALAAAGASPLILSGDSAGGGLAASIVSSETVKHRCAGLALHSPWLDLTVSAPSYRYNATNDPRFSEDAARRSADLYLQGHPADDPRVSPMFAQLDGFPPTLLTVGSGEVLRDDARTFARKLGEAQVAAELVEIADMEHTAPVRALHLPGAEAAMTATVRFVNAVAGC